MELDNLCMGCMEEKGVSQTCPHCGFKEGTIPESALHLPPGTVLYDKYILGRVLGHGGFGITYLAWDMSLNIKLAIKEYMPQQLVYRSNDEKNISLFKTSLSADFNYGLSKFLDEARTLARFHEHPNIVTVRDYFEANETAYLVMNYHQGITLREYLQARGDRIDTEKAINIFMPVLDALSEVHKIGILHRDISPDNLIIDARGGIVLIDFGAARQAVGEKSRSLSVILKAGYSPVEQYQSKGKQGPWTDIYAAAATFYHVVTGQMPPESLDRLQEDTLKLPSTLKTDISEYQENALLKALAVRAEDRFQSVEEFQSALVGETPVEVKKLSTTPNMGSGEPAKPPVKDENADHDKSKPSKTGKPLIVAAVIFLVLVAGVYVGSFILPEGTVLLRIGNVAIESTGAADEESPVVSDSMVGNGNNGAVNGDTQLTNNEVAVDLDENNGVEIAEDMNYRGNSLGNIVNVGIAASFDDRIYYRRDGNADGVFSLDLESGEQFLVVPDDAWNINAADGWIYYSNRAENWHVYKVRTDGTERTRINRDDSGNLQLAGSWLYYRNDDEDGKIYRMRPDGSNRSRVHDEEAYFLNVVGDWIYFQNRSDGGKIYKIRSDGSERTRINSDDSWNINVSGDWIYYSTPDANWNIFRIRTDGTGRTRINSDDSGNVNVSEGWIYYRNDDDNSSLYRIRVDGSERTRLNSDQSYFHSIHGDWIYYQNRSDNRRTYKVRLDGSDRQALY